MSFIHLSYLIPLVIFLVVYVYLILNSDKKFFKWVEDHWFYKRSLLNKVSTLLYILGFSLICLAMLDLRGPEEHVKGKSVDQKTIILIDSSASMLAEDVRPNRFSKSLLLVKHYIKKAVGQQISIVVFSDSQKRIIPFTDDIDLLKARINRLEEMNLNRGGTGLSQAIQESVQYFRNTSDDISGNILIFTDAEETEFGFDIKIPETITVGVIGVGSRKGAPIPVRNRNGEFIGNKKFEGKDVVSKLDEDFLKKLSTVIKNYKYWIATSYSIPTEDILNFFNRINKIKESDGEFRVRPVLTNYLLVPGMVLLILSTLLKFSKIFIPLVLLLLVNVNAFSQQDNPPEEKEPEKSARTLELELKFAENKLPKQGVKALAFNLLKDKFSDQAQVLYEEILDPDIKQENLNDYFNYALTLINNKKIDAGVKVYSDLLEYLDKYEAESTKEYRENITKNVLKALEQQSGGKGKSDQDKKDEQGQKGDSPDDQSKSDKSEKQSDKKDNKSSKSKEDQQKESDQKDQNDKQDQKEKDGKAEEKIAKKKVPSILKQLISDDNNLQKKLIDAETIEQKSRKIKDW